MDQDAYEEEFNQDTIESNHAFFTYQHVEERIMNVHWEIKDYLYECGEPDLLAYWGFEQTAACLYESSYLEQIKEANPL